MYTIGQISLMFDIPISTLRYYDKEGLFPDIQRISGIRTFSDVVKSEIERLEKTLAMIKFKHWYYDQAIKDRNEDRIIDMIPNALPKDIQELYDTAHSSQTVK